MNENIYHKFEFKTSYKPKNISELKYEKTDFKKFDEDLDQFEERSNLLKNKILEYRKKNLENIGVLYFYELFNKNIDNSQLGTEEYPYNLYDFKPTSYNFVDQEFHQYSDLIKKSLEYNNNKLRRRILFERPFL